MCRSVSQGILVACTGELLLDCLPYLLSLQAAKRECIRACSSRAGPSGCCPFSKEPQAGALSSGISHREGLQQ